MNQNMRGNSSQQVREQLIYWLIWNICLPVSLFFVFWPLYKFVLGLHLSFDRSFGNGDLLLFSGLLLIMTSVRLESDSAWRKKLNWLWDLQRLLAVIILTVYGMMRMDVLQQSFGGSIDESKLRTYSLLSLSVLALSVSLTIFNVLRDFTTARNGESSDA